MKTAKQWFQQLPEPYRTQAMENATEIELSQFHPSLHHAIGHAIDWGASEQGGEYWDKLFVRARKGEFDTPTPNLHGWIPVSERLPTKEDADEFGEILILDTNKTKSFWDWNFGNSEKYNITHWQPLPKLPETL